MSTPRTLPEIAKALVDAFARVWGARLGGEATVAPSEAAQGAGWLVTMAIGGAVAGRLTVWFDRKAAGACARKLLDLPGEPTDDQTAALLGEMFAEAGGAVMAAPECAGMTLGAPAMSSGAPAQDAQTFFLAVPNAASCQIAVAAEAPRATAAATLPGDSRFNAVLDVDLPLIVRFGRAVMPLRAIADLGPGSVVDLGRSPDEPVELLVGEKLIARGEVVIVGGNYGVRITELTADREPATELEARTS